ncbi:glycyl-tRNA synthetase beta chain [Desulforamulus reducens MI-1]|uniref:Glycine--tRNA ligase beta subunit n=1 Tax=Desulforamulus reducens (strain ATCC BAA-1160 / DSM 100696 / MI-1) TaxID=349161 RepID=SYGB_DESRM|nr:glycine--tRNA ligase subunit beta [Desulforamulus reducens]A4J7C9.1 RecName: Full=Glycine--tRNA ligase beta subunit; AltName: Full=Glycyl-tRNA synthetase beta subunit; Short=GlyRS [Desulforamulus reducens MI-1]ABO50982.1 glycyl-tRNA synthetase beta chain [Desulforamulus reducens MI-1]
MAKDFLLEVGIEEMPARFLGPALTQLKEQTVKTLQELRIEYADIQTYGTPRRLVLYIKDLAENQAALEKEVKGPAKKAAFDAAGNPTKAILGFTRSQGVSMEDLVVRSIGQVEYLYALKREEGRPTAQVLAEICPGLIAGLHFPKPMRWGELELRFARPIRWLLALFGEAVVPFELANLQSNRFTYGHRFLSTGDLSIANPEDYFTKIRGAYVLIDPAERKELIWQQVQELATAEGGVVEKDEDLLDEITNILEWPTALCGTFDEDYLKLPGAVLVTPMREHQRYFPVVSNEGKLLNKFIAVRNGTRAYIEIVTAGNEKVLRARLADAAFFFEEDLKQPLASKVNGLQKVVFLEGLGSIADKVDRIGAMADHLAETLGANEEQRENIQRGALLAKADLITNMVYEFPELQGEMGREYALRNGEAPEVAEAIFEHYLPRFAGDLLPETLAGSVLSVADKMDSIVGCFAIGIQPTGSQDPYALRRQALGICHMLIEGNIHLSLRELVQWAYQGYHEGVELKQDLNQVITEIEEFFKQRLKGILNDRGLSYDTVDAVLTAGFDDIADVVDRGMALAAFRELPAFAALMTAFNRANNLAKHATTTQVQEVHLEHSAEQELYGLLTKLEGEVRPLLEQKNYALALQKIATIQSPLDTFFESVMVMVEDEAVKTNRLALLKKLVGLSMNVADFSKIVVETK